MGTPPARQGGGDDRVWAGDGGGGNGPGGHGAGGDRGGGLSGRGGGGAGPGYAGPPLGSDLFFSCRWMPQGPKGSTARQPKHPRTSTTTRPRCRVCDEVKLRGRPRMIISGLLQSIKGTDESLGG